MLSNKFHHLDINIEKYLRM